MEAKLLSLNPRANVRKTLRRENRVAPEGGRVLQVFLNSDLRNGHDGLRAMAKAAGIDVAGLKPGEFVVFLNAEKNKLKLFAAFNVVAYLKLEHGRVYDLRVLARIPQAFQASGQINYDEQLRAHLEEALARKRRAVLSAR